MWSASAADGVPPGSGVPTPPLAVSAFAAAMLASAPALASPFVFDAGLPIDAPGVVQTVDQDLHRQGYVTAFRSAGMRAALRGQARPRARVSLMASSGLNAPPSFGWTLVTATATGSVFASLIATSAPPSRPDAVLLGPPLAGGVLNLGEVARLDDGSRAVRRVVEGAAGYAPSTDDPSGGLVGTR